MIMKLWRAMQKRRNPVAFFRKQGATIGEGCELNCETLGGEPYLVTMGNHVRINKGVQLITHDGGVWVLRQYSKMENAAKLDKFGGISIGNNVHIGTNAIIMPGVTIGDNVIIGCMAVVTRDIPSNSVAVGIPARVIETVDEYESKNKDKFEYTKGMSAEEKRSYLVKKYKSM